jgi:AcrR family transcriptional regulator
MGRPREHGSETRARLLRVAGEVLAREGAGAVAVRRVARESGTSSRAVYSLFGDREGLMRELFREAAETMRRYHEAVPVRDDPIAEVVELAAAYRAGAAEQPNLYGLYLGWADPQLRLGDHDVALAFRSADRVLDALERAAAAGLLGGRDPKAVGLQMWALVHGLASLELHGYLGPESQATDRWEDAVRSVLAGYGLPTTLARTGPTGARFSSR